MSYPQGSVVRYLPNKIQNQYPNNDISYARRVFGFLHLHTMFSSNTDTPQLCYYQANGRYSNMCAPDDEWVGFIHYFFQQPASMLFTLQCGLMVVMFLFTVNALIEKSCIIFNLIHLVANMFIQKRYVFRFWHIRSK